MFRGVTLLTLLLLTNNSFLQCLTYFNFLSNISLLTLYLWLVISLYILIIKLSTNTIAKNFLSNKNIKGTLIIDTIILITWLKLYGKKISNTLFNIFPPSKGSIGNKLKLSNTWLTNLTLLKVVILTYPLQ